MSERNYDELVRSIDLFLKENYHPETAKRKVKSARSGDYCMDLMSLESAAPAKPRKSRSLEDTLNHLDDNFTQTLFRFIDERGLKDSEVYKASHIDRRLFSKIRTEKDYKPSQDTVLCFCIGLKLEIDDALDLLKSAGFTLSGSIKRDVIIRYFIEHEDYDFEVINEVLFCRYNQQPIGC